MESTYGISQFESRFAYLPRAGIPSQVLLLDGEKTGKDTGSIRDARELVMFQAFLDRHKDQPSLVPESNEAMKDSHPLLDEKMKFVGIFVYFDTHDERFCGRFFNCTDSGKKPGRSLLDVGVQKALKDAGFDEKAFFDRGGIFEWSRNKDGEEAIPEW